jgi:formate hydrogenlyase subunit 6/NADH:ubiquinone oxidoreductase subunit I
MPYRVRSLVYMLPQIVRAVIAPPITVRFPFGPAEIPQGYRGLVRIRADLCRGCSLCVRDCPAFALELIRENRETFQLIYYPDRCAYCGQCELSCNFGAIYQQNELAPSTKDLSDLATVLVDRKPKGDPETKS